MTSGQIRVFHQRLKTALNLSRNQATLTISGRLVQDCIEVLDYAIKEGDEAVFDFLLSLRPICDNLP